MRLPPGPLESRVPLFSEYAQPYSPADPVSIATLSHVRALGRPRLMACRMRRAAVGESGELESSDCPRQALTDALPASRISCESARSSTARARTIAPTNVA